MFKRAQIIQWNIIEREIIDEIIFRTINTRNKVMLELMPRAGMLISVKLTPDDIDGRKPPSDTLKGREIKNLFT